jgi:hypothetical protein
VKRLDDPPAFSIDADESAIGRRANPLGVTRRVIDHASHSTLDSNWIDPPWRSPDRRGYRVVALQEHVCPGVDHLVEGLTSIGSSGWVNALNRLVAQIHHPDTIVPSNQTARTIAHVNACAVARLCCARLGGPCADSPLC